MISNFLEKIFTLLIFSTLILNPGILAGNSDTIPYCHQAAMFDTSSELTHGIWKYRQAVVQGPHTYCHIDSNLEIQFSPKLYAYRLYIHQDLMMQLSRQGQRNVTIESSLGRRRSRRCAQPSNEKNQVTIRSLPNELYYLWDCGDVELIDRLSMAIEPPQANTPHQNGKHITFLSFEKFLSSNSSIPLVLVKVKKCLNNPPAVQGATWHYKHQGNFLWISYQCNESFSLGYGTGEVSDITLECNHGNWSGEVPRCQVITSTDQTDDIIGWSMFALIGLVLVGAGFGCGRSRCCKRRRNSKNDGPNTNQKDNSSFSQIADSALPPRAREEQIYETLDYSTVRRALNKNNTSQNNRREDIHLYDYPVLPYTGPSYDDATRSDLTNSSVSLGTFPAGLTDSAYLTPT